MRTKLSTRSTARYTLPVAAGLVLLVGFTLLQRARNGAGMSVDGGSAQPGDVLVLALPAFLAGLLSFLSPCCLPILPTYFAWTFQARRERIVRMTIAFFLGLATTMVVLGATASLLNHLLLGNLRHLTLVGGLVVAGFGVMSLMGKGFSGFQILDRPTASVAGSYLYGATFALGWSACVGPILGALLTMLATQGAAVLQGALLAFIYALGLGTPLILTATMLSRVGQDSRVWRLLRGRGFTVRLGSFTVHLHTTNLASGLLLIVVGALLATGQLAVFSRWAVQTPFTQGLLDLEEHMRVLLLGR
jgi:cytochrome c-type biogenesis protein